MENAESEKELGVAEDAWNPSGKYQASKRGAETTMRVNRETQTLSLELIVPFDNDSEDEIRATVAGFDRNLRRLFQMAKAPVSMMLEVGVEGHLFNKHPETSTCHSTGCVPFDESLHVKRTMGTYATRKTQ